MAMQGILLVNGVTEILKPLIFLISEQITLAWGVKDDLRKLKDTLESIQALITSAEEKQVHDAAVRLWLRRLKDVIYDADDVMDEFSYENMRPSKHRVRALVSSSNPLLFRFRMASKIRAINERLDEIHKNGERYMLRNTSPAQDNQTREQRNRLTSSVVDESLLLGREGAKSDIIEILIDTSSTGSSSSGISSQSEKLSTLSIVGMGGLGKTAVAQMVYEDGSIVRNFEPRAWVCVSDTFDIYKILIDVIESFTGKKCEDPSNVDVLTKQVKEKLTGKKYLLVLDDLWNEDVRDWEKLKSCLIYGGIGSKILVTTRSQKVASVVGGPVHDLQKLPDDVCWSIIKEKVLSRGGAVLSDKMTNIGAEIARKCDGLPLTANSLGSLMCSRRDESYWMSIVNNINHLQDTQEHTRIISILKLSYDNLSSPLKQCFSYCCIFPKDWEINREMLIRLWMAEGFLFSSSGGENISLEDIGNEYFEYLVWSSFFQDVKKDQESGDIETCKMHDLVHDLATSLVDCNEFGIAKAGDGKAEFSEVRRLQLLFDTEPSLASLKFPSPKVLSTKLRTIIALYPEKHPHISFSFRYRRLRILCSLSYWSGCSLSGGLEFRLVGRKLCSASSISKLKHLRYLDLSYCKLSSELSLNHCYNLQTLVLRGCGNVPSLLLKEIGSLRNLRHVDISGTDIKIIPENIGLLKHLSFLDVSSTSITKLPDSVTCITSLRTLNLYRCTDLDALPRELGALTRLRFLNLEYTKIKVLPESCISNLCNLEIVKLGWECELPKEIKNWPKLRILTHRRRGDVMARGIERLACLETLESYMVRQQESEVYESSNTSGIEDLADLNSLQVLKIRNLENVRGGKEGAERAKLQDKQHLRELDLEWGSAGDDDEEVRNTRSVKDTTVLEGLQPHSNLKELTISGFSGAKLSKWMMGCSFSICLPNLVELSLTDCNNSEKLPALGMLPFLKVLFIGGMKSVKCLGGDFYYEDENEGESSSSSSNTTKRSSLFPSLESLSLELESLEEWFAPPPLVSSSSCFPSLESLCILYHQRLRTIPVTWLSSLKKLRLEGTNEDSVNSLFNRRGGGEGCLTSLTEIAIFNSPDLIHLPPLGALLQHNLQTLLIVYCSNFQCFRDDDDVNNNSISSFQSLQIEDCPVLTSLPDLRLYTSLRKLTLRRCDKLNKESIPYDMKTSLAFLEELNVDFLEKDK